MVGEKRGLNSQTTNGTVIPGDHNIQPATHFMGRLRHMLNQPELPHLITEPDCMRAPQILKMNVQVARYNQLAVIGSKCFQQGGKLRKKCRGWRRRAGAVDGKQCQRTTGCSKRQAQSFVCSHANRQGDNLDPVDRLEADDDSSVVLWRRPPSLFSLFSLPWQVTERVSWRNISRRRMPRLGDNEDVKIMSDDGVGDIQ